MTMQLGAITFMDFPDESVSIRARVDILLAEETDAIGEVQLSLELSREELGKMTFNEISDLAIRKATAALATAK